MSVYAFCRGTHSNVSHLRNSIFFKMAIHFVNNSLKYNVLHVIERNCGLLPKVTFITLRGGGNGRHRLDCFAPPTLLWRHNGQGGVSNHQPHDCLLNRLFRCRSKKTSKLRVTGLCAGNSPGTGEFPAQMASNAENVSIWWRHHEHSTFRRRSALSEWDLLSIEPSRKHYRNFVFMIRNSGHFG